MGTGIEAARAVSPEAAAAIDNMKDQLILVLIRRMGGSITVPVREVDDTGGLVLSMRVDQATPGGPSFVFELGRKQ